MLANTIRQANSVFRATAPLLRSTVRYKAAYEGDGKTTVRVLNLETELGLMIDSYATFGFRLNNGITVLGPMAIFPRSVFSWQVHKAKDITPESLRFFKVLDPKIDLLVVGLETIERKLIASVLQAARANNLNVELLPTEHACATFNFLNSEGRSVAAVLIPPLSIDQNEDDMLNSRLHYEDIYNAPLT